jgi:hypothetical protein
MKRSAVIFGVVLVFGLFAVSQAGATLLTFEDVEAPVNEGSPYNSYVWGNENYGGLTWSGRWGVVNTAGYPEESGYYYNNQLGGDNVAFFASQNGTISVGSGQKLNFESVYMTSAWRDGLSIEFVGMRVGSEIYSHTEKLSTTDSTLVELGFTDIDTLAFSVFGESTPHEGWDYAFEHFSFDNMSYYVTPEPGTLLLMAVGLVGLVGIRRKWKS